MRFKLLTIFAALLFVSIGRVTATAQDIEKTDYPPVPDSIMKAELSTVDGKKFTLADLKGKIVLVNLWGNWCGPCREQMPVFSKLQTKYGESGLEVIGINIGDAMENVEPPEKLMKFSESMMVGYTVTQTHPAVTKSIYELSRQQAVPQSIVIDRDGRLRGIFVGAASRINEKIEALITKTIAEVPLQHVKK